MASLTNLENLKKCDRVCNQTNTNSGVVQSSHPYGARVFKEISHVGKRDLLSQPSDVDGAVLRLILLTWVSWSRKKHTL